MTSRNQTSENPIHLNQQQEIDARIAHVMPHLNNPKYVEKEYGELVGITMAIRELMRDTSMPEEKRRSYEMTLNILDMHIAQQDERDRMVEDAKRAIRIARRAARDNVKKRIPMCVCTGNPGPDLTFVEKPAGEK